MLFAAGFGTRMGDLTKTRPKPLVPVGGRPLVDYALDVAAGAGVSQIVANTHYLADQVADHLAPKGVLIAHEAPDVLETGGGLRHALPLLQADPVFTLNSDAVWLGRNPLTALAGAWNPETMDALLLLTPTDTAVAHKGTGDFELNREGRIRRGQTYTYTGAQIIRTNGLAAIPEKVFSLNLLWDMMIGRGRLYGLVYNGTWCDVGTAAAIKTAENLLLENRDA